jgi:CRISPR-associated endonuclease/helicase Cas3
MMKDKLKNLLAEHWAKDDGTTIREHTDKLLENLEILKKYYKEEIEQLIPNELPKELKENFWEILTLACEYHDYGKIHCMFQKKIGNKSVKSIRELPEVKHNLLSPVFVDIEDKLIQKIVRLLVLHHHPVEEVAIEDVERVLKEEFGFEKNPIRFMLKKDEREYLKEDIAETLGLSEEKLLQYYWLLKGLLLRIDHASSSKHVKEVEEIPPDDTLNFVDEFFLRQQKTLNDMQVYIKKNRDKNLVVIAPTGAGKTEAGFIYLKKKGFFMLPYRVSSNGIYIRAEEIFKNYTGLLHSSALSYLLEKGEYAEAEDIRNNQEDAVFLNYFLSRNYAKPIIISTPDQLMHFVFKYKGFEKYYTTALYSRLVIDELQAYDPITLAFIVKALEVIANAGGKFLIITATFPEFLKEDFKKKIGVQFKIFNLQQKPFHNVKIIDKNIDEYLSLLEEKAKEAKVLVVVNTVAKAIELKEKLEENISNVYLLHSRFIQKHRKEKEREIKSFFDRGNTGVWITTQLAEVSLDLDADYLFTELSTADSLIQRMGRCNRKGEKPTDKPNVFIFTKDCSGIGPVYNKDIHIKTLNNLGEGIWNWDFKWQLMETVYSLPSVKETNYFKKYEKACTYISNLWAADAESLIKTKSEAKQLFREIHAVNVIPVLFKDKVEKLIEEWEKTKGNLIKKTKILNQVLEYTFQIPYLSFEKLRHERANEKLGIYYVDGEYNENYGFKLPEKSDTELVDNLI